MTTDPAYAVEYVRHETPSELAAGQIAKVKITLKNTSNRSWAARGENPVRLGYRWYTLDGTEVPLALWDDLRTGLFLDLPPDRSITLNAEVGVPRVAGQYQLQWDVVEEMVAWFSWQGSPPLSLPISVKMPPQSLPETWSVAASHNNLLEGRDNLLGAFDERSFTRWSSQADQEAGMWFELDLGQVRAIEGVRLEVPEAVNHNPRGYDIQVSENKDYWLTVAEDKNNDSLVAVEFETQLARYVRIILTQDADRWWSIHEIKVDFYEPPPPPEALDVSEAGLRFIAAHEGLRLQMYNDAANHCTIGVGHLIHLGPCDGRASEGPFLQGISQVRAEELLKQDAQAKVEAVRSLVTVALNQAQFDALVSFVFNVGRGNFARSDLLAQLNQGNYEAVPSELKRWNKAGGKVLPGLVRRREEEAKLFTAGVYGAG